MRVVSLRVILDCLTFASFVQDASDSPWTPKRSLTAFRESSTALGEYKKRVGEVICESLVDRPAGGKQAVPQCAEEHLNEEIDVDVAL